MHVMKDVMSTVFLKNSIQFLIAACCFVSATALLAQDATPRPVLNVSGEGVISIPVKYAEIMLSVTSTKPTAAQAQADAAKRADKLVQMLKGEQVAQLKTVRIALNTLVHDKKTGREVEYFAVNTLSFRVEIDRAGELLDKSVAAGANNIDSVQLIPEDRVLAAARKQAMAAAALDAREKADVVLGALGLRAKQILQIDVDLQFATPYPMRQVMNEMRESTTPVVGGDANVRANVRLSVGY